MRLLWRPHKPYAKVFVFSTLSCLSRLISIKTPSKIYAYAERDANVNIPFLEFSCTSSVCLLLYYKQTNLEILTPKENVLTRISDLLPLKHNQSNISW